MMWSSPSDEIEVTPEMVKAGARELGYYPETYSTRDEVVVDIYKAMVLASRANLDFS
jgi:hypothetical protein